MGPQLQFPRMRRNVWGRPAVAEFQHDQLREVLAQNEPKPVRTAGPRVGDGSPSSGQLQLHSRGNATHIHDGRTMARNEWGRPTVAEFKHDQLKAVLAQNEPKPVQTTGPRVGEPPRRVAAVRLRAGSGEGSGLTTPLTGNPRPVTMNRNARDHIAGCNCRKCIAFRADFGDVCVS
jgi:hypothetical protein